MIEFFLLKLRSRSNPPAARHALSPQRQPSAQPHHKRRSVARHLIHTPQLPQATKFGQELYIEHLNVLLKWNIPKILIPEG